MKKSPKLYKVRFRAVVEQEILVAAKDEAAAQKYVENNKKRLAEDVDAEAKVCSIEFASLSLLTSPNDTRQGPDDYVWSDDKDFGGFPIPELFWWNEADAIYREHGSEIDGPYGEKLDELRQRWIDAQAVTPAGPQSR